MIIKRSTGVCILLAISNVLFSGALILVVLGVIPLPAQYLPVNTDALPLSPVAMPIEQRIDVAASASERGAERQAATKRTVTRDEQENIRVYNEVNEGVVNITTEVISYNWFLEPVPRAGSTGSGSIIDEDGYVVTNNHVVRNTTSVFVTLANGERYDASVIGADVENDIAVIKFTPPANAPLTVVPFGTSRDLQIGLKVLAIGNPFGLDRTLTTGIISGLNRPVRVSRNLVVNNMIQTDASINPGNSGGPLLDSAGNLVGINTAIFSPSGGSIGIGFAIPADTAKRVVPELIQNGTVVRGWIDITPRQLFPQLVQYADLPVTRGILISDLATGSNAAVAGLRGGSKAQAISYGGTIIYLGGDIIVGIDAYDVRDIASLYAALEDTKPGQTVTVRYVRGDQERETQVVLSERPQKSQWI